MLFTSTSTGLISNICAYARICTNTGISAPIRATRARYASIRGMRKSADERGWVRMSACFGGIRRMETRLSAILTHISAPHTHLQIFAEICVQARGDFSLGLNHHTREARLALARGLVLSLSSLPLELAFCWNLICTVLSQALCRTSLPMICRMLLNLIATYKLSGSRDALAMKCIVLAGVVFPAWSGRLHTLIYGHILNAELTFLPGASLLSE